MIIPDINLLIYAYDQSSPFHTTAKKWLSSLLDGKQEVGIPLVCILGFIRLVSNPRIFEQPLTPEEACSNITISWLDTPNAAILHSGTEHLKILSKLLNISYASSNLTTDAHLAALAIENQAVIHTNDKDFRRFKKVRWKNPLDN